LDENCGNCKFYISSEHTIGNNAFDGTCRRYPPTPLISDDDDYQTSPSVYAAKKEWCGEWKAGDSVPWNQIIPPGHAGQKKIPAHCSHCPTGVPIVVSWGGGMSETESFCRDCLTKKEKGEL